MSSAEPCYVMKQVQSWRRTWSLHNALQGHNCGVLITCVECQKPRVIFSNKKLRTSQEMLLAVTVSEYEYSCGSTLFPPSCHNLIKELTINQYLSCQQPVEVSYYVSDVGRKDLCCHCAGINAIVDPALKKQFKTVLPICDSCVADRKVAVTQRPFGKASKKRN